MRLFSIVWASITSWFRSLFGTPSRSLPTPDTSSTPIPTPTRPSEEPWAAALKKTREPFLARLSDALKELGGTPTWGEDHPVWTHLEETLLMADVGPTMTDKLLASLKRDFRENPSADELRQKLRVRMREVLEAVPARAVQEGKPQVTVLIGVNGAGKTTTAAKLAAQAKAAGRTVILGAGDTFRAAAVEQLKTWADRIGVECVVPAQGANPAAVAFDAVAAGIARGADEVILDTAGRLHTKDNLMDELKKVVRVIDKKLPGAPHRVLLVLDATLGQNALAQAREFSGAVPTTGVVLTKLDGSARGGAVFAVSAELGVPVALVGVGEKAEDLRAFSPQEFVEHLVP